MTLHCPIILCLQQNECVLPQLLLPSPHGRHSLKIWAKPGLGIRRDFRKYLHMSIIHLIFFENNSHGKQWQNGNCEKTSASYPHIYSETIWNWASYSPEKPGRDTYFTLLSWWFAKTPAVASKVDLARVAIRASKLVDFSLMNTQLWKRVQYILI